MNKQSQIAGVNTSFVRCAKSVQLKNKIATLNKYAHSEIATIYGVIKSTRKELLQQEHYDLKAEYEASLHSNFKEINAVTREIADAKQTLKVIKGDMYVNQVKHAMNKSIS